MSSTATARVRAATLAQLSTSQAKAKDCTVTNIRYDLLFFLLALASSA